MAMGHPSRCWTPPDGIVFEAQRPDVYTAVAGNQRVQVIAGVLDPREAEINRTALGGEAFRLPATGRRGSVEPWMLLLLMAALLLLVEWTTYMRRVTT